MDGWARTSDLVVPNHARYQLRYTHKGWNRASSARTRWELWSQRAHAEKMSPDDEGVNTFFVAVGSTGILEHAFRGGHRPAGGARVARAR